MCSISTSNTWLPLQYVAYSLAKQKTSDMAGSLALAGFKPLALPLPGHQFILVSYSQCWKLLCSVTVQKY